MDTKESKAGAGFWCAIGVAVLIPTILFVNRFYGYSLFMPGPVVITEGVPITKKQAEQIAIYDFSSNDKSYRPWHLSVDAETDNRGWTVFVKDHTAKMFGTGQATYFLSDDGKIIHIGGAL